MMQRPIMTIDCDHSDPIAVWQEAPQAWHLDETTACVWRVLLDDPQLDWQAARAVLSPEERAREISYKRAVDGQRFARTRGVLRLLLSQYCGAAPENLEWLISDHGKPGLAPHPANRGVQFNVSHSGTIALVAIGRRRVGVDVERIRSGVACLAIARRYFSPREVHELESLPLEQQTPAFFRCWTRKEALVKATGNGIAGGLARFSVSLLPGAAAELLEGTPSDATPWQLFNLEPGDGYAAALAMEGNAAGSVRCYAWPPYSR
jgi:4'-phosphopantetheinyl transferase